MDLNRNPDRNLYRRGTRDAYRGSPRVAGMPEAYLAGYDAAKAKQAQNAANARKA